MNGDTIKAVRELPLGAWLLIAIAAAGLAGLVIFHPELVPEPYPNTRKWIVLVALIASPIAFLWGAWRVLQATFYAIRMPQWLKVRKIRKRYDRLFQTQKELLDRTYKTGRDNFEVSLEDSQLRIFKQLEEEGFIEVHPTYVYYANMSVSCSLTPECSKALRQIHNMV